MSGLIKEITKYSCQHESILSTRIFGAGYDRLTNVSYPCYDCQLSMLGARCDVVRYGYMPIGGKSYNYRDNKYEIGVSCYLPNMRVRPEFSEGRNILTGSAIIVGWGGDCEPLIDLSTFQIKKNNTVIDLAPVPLCAYQIIDGKTGFVVGNAKTLRSAWNKCNKLDLVYGAVRYCAKRVDA